MHTAFALAFFSLFVLVPVVVGKSRYCESDDASCWPSEENILAFAESLDFSISRSLYWPGFPYPRVCSVPIGSPDDQPLYGAAGALLPLYVKSKEDEAHSCFVDSYYSDFCLVSTRNNPVTGEPAFVAWPTTVGQVQEAVRFAGAHNLCVSVAGTGHDFLNRHSCSGGLFIRMSLFKGVEFNLDDRRARSGTVRFGAGITFSEAHFHTATTGRVVASGWSPTVGIVGWSIGGGHGPMTPSMGLGVDNIIEAELVTSSGDIVVANETVNRDLLWALRGGGGSTWGVITSLTLKLHPNPPYGFTQRVTVWEGDFCSGRATLDALIDSYLDWALALGSNWAGIAMITPTAKAWGAHCATWSAYVKYVYAGDGFAEPSFNVTWQRLIDSVPSSSVESGDALDAGVVSDDMGYAGTPWDSFSDAAAEYIVPTSYLGPSLHFVGGIPSVLLSRHVVARGDAGMVIKMRLHDCQRHGLCFRQELYHDLTGNIGSPRPSFVSVSPGLRNAVINLVSVGWDATRMQAYYALGQYSYFSESAYELPDWKQRYWGENYRYLVGVKFKWDPTGRFGCRHCIGDQNRS